MGMRAWIVGGALLAAAIPTAVLAQDVIVNGPRDRIDPRGPIDPPAGKPRARSEQPRREDAGRCNGKVCRIGVRVREDCAIAVDPAWVFIGAQDVNILWELRTPAYAFNEVDGIDFKSEYNEGWSKQFVESRRLDRRTWAVRDLNSDRSVFRYNISVIDEKTGKECRVDPGLVNDWP
jgi:hypothetical protein